MTTQYKQMEQDLQKKIVKLTGDVEEQEKTMAIMKEDINGLNLKKE